jgi:alpha-mannosidase
VRESYNLNVPLRAAMGIGETNGALPRSYSLVNADRANIIIETVKKAEDSDAVIVRAYECWNRKTETTFAFGGNVKRISECDLMEENAVPLSSATMMFKPFEIKTLMVELE